MGKQGPIQPHAVVQQIELAPRVIAYAGSSLMCEMLDISDSTLWEWVRKGHLPRPVKIGTTSRWKWADVEKRLSYVDDGPDDPILRASRG